MENHTQQFLPDIDPQAQIGREEVEIDLMDYFTVIWKRRISISLIFAIIVAITAVAVFLMPKTFQATALVEVGRYKTTPLQNVSDINVIFSGNTMLENISNDLDIASVLGAPDIRSNFDINPAKITATSFLQINGRGRTPQEALDLVNAVSKELIKYHKTLFGEAQVTLDAEMAALQTSQEKTRQGIQKTQQNVTSLDNDIRNYQKEIAKRAAAVTQGQGMIAASYLNALTATKDQKVRILDQLSDLQEKLSGLDVALQRKNYENTYETKPTSIVEPPVLPQSPIAPHVLQNILISAVLGLFVGVLYAFSAEYFINQKKIK